jgi:hypothetical protein
MTTNLKAIAGIIGAGVVAALFIVWLVFFNTPTITPDVSQPQFGSGTTATSVVTPNTTNEAQTVEQVSTQKVFKISNGPVAGAALIEVTRPTSTIARFVLATNGHIFDFAIDTPGAVPKSISNTTIPGIARTVWSEGGRGALVQYLDIDTVKTAHIALPPAATSSTNAGRIQFLPTGAQSVAVSPDGASVAYFLLTTSGSTVYIARADGANAKSLASLSFSQLILSWPSQGTLLAYTPSAAGVPGVALTIDSRTGAVGSLLYAAGLTATADRTFSQVVYQTVTNSRDTYVQNVRTGLSRPLSFDPMPESCRWSLVSSSTLYCPAPYTYVGPSYVDLWHLGAQSAPNSLFSFDVGTGRTTLITTPGERDGGERSDIAELVVSQSDLYLLFIRKNDRSLWGVRLRD